MNEEAKKPEVTTQPPPEPPPESGPGKEPAKADASAPGPEVVESDHFSKEPTQAQMLGVAFVEIWVKGKKYTCLPPQASDHNRYAEGFREKKRQDAEEVLKVLKRNDVDDGTAVNAYLEERNKADLGSRFAFSLAMHTLDGWRHYFHACARRHEDHKNLTRKEVDELVDDSNWEDIGRQLEPLFITNAKKEIARLKKVLGAQKGEDSPAEPSSH